MRLILAAPSDGLQFPSA
jgi:hypothetical protein